MKNKIIKINWIKMLCFSIVTLMVITAVAFMPISESKQQPIPGTSFSGRTVRVSVKKKIKNMMNNSLGRSRQ